MPIKQTPADITIKNALLRGLPDYVGPNDESGKQLAQQENGYPVAIFSLQDILAGGDLGSAHQIGWGIIASAANGTAAAAQVTQSDQPGGWALTTFSEGPEISMLIASIKALDTLPEVQTNDYSVNILRIPGVLLETLWLKSQSGTPDLIVPFHTTSNRIIANHPYSAAEFIEAVRPIAIECEEFDNLYQG